MKVDIIGPIAHLAGNWTRTEMTDSNIDSLAVSLQQLETSDGQNLRIDCGQINEIDASGLQLIYFWLRRFSFRGFELEIVNRPDKLQKTLQNLLLKSCYTEKSLAMAKADLTPNNPWRRKTTSENRRDQGHCQAIQPQNR